MAKVTKKSSMKIATKVIHVGGHPDKETGAVIAPIYQTTTYAQVSPGKHQGYDYSRCQNPSRTRLEECLASLEEAKYALVVSSGIAMVSLILHSLPKGSTVLCGDDVYGGTYRLLTTVFQDIHDIHFINTTNIKEVENSMRDLSPALIWLESPTNPLLKITDISKVTTLAKKFKVLSVVDNTFMSPYFQRPLELGADVVMHSMTKYLNGHSDVLGGCLMTNNKSFYEKCWTLQKSIGPTSSPFDSWLVSRGLKTLAIRMEAHQKNALEIAKYLEAHPKVEKVLYPGLKSHPQYRLAKKQMSGFSGMITFFLKGDLKKSKKFLERVRLFSLAESLGGVESLIEHPAIMTHASVPKKVREEVGIFDNLIRLSVGIEDTKDLIHDLEEAFKVI